MSETEQRLDGLRLTVLHNRYRQPGGEERWVEELHELAGRAGAQVCAVERDSSDLGGARSLQAAAALALGGRAPKQNVAAAGPGQLVHAHNIHPSFGWRTLAAYREAGAAVVLHLQNYRLFCATGVASRDGHDCFECAPRSTWHGVRHRCRDNAGQAVAYAIGLGLWQRRLLAQVDVLAAPCRALLDDLANHGVGTGGEVLANWIGPEWFAPNSAAAAGGYALVATRVVPEKGVDVAVRACAVAGVPLKVAGTGPALAEVRELADRLGADVEFAGQLDAAALTRLRAGAAFALVPSTWREVQPYAAIESLAAGLPVIASDTAALSELTTPDLLFEPGDHQALAAIVARLHGDRQALGDAGDAALRRAHERHSQAAAMRRLNEIYALALERRASSQAAIREPISAP